MTDRPGALSAAKRALLRQAMTRELAAGGEADRPPPRHGPIPLTAFQHGIWVAAALADDRAAYVVPVCLRLRGPLDGAALAAALRVVADRHEALRTVIEPSGDQPCQRVIARLDVELVREDLSALDRPARLSTARTRAAAMAMARFELAAGPLVRAALYALDRDDHVLALAVHHVIADGASIDLLVRELLELHDAAAAGRAPVLPALAWQLQDVARWSQARRDPAREAAELDAAAARLVGAGRELDLAFDRPRPARPSHRGARTWLAIAPETIDALERLARDEGATLFMAFAAGVAALIGRRAGAASVLLGFPVTRRERRDHAGVVGPLMNTLVLRGDLDGRPSFRALVRRVRGDMVAALRAPDVSLAALAERLGPGRSSGPIERPALCSVYVTLEDAGAWRSAALEVEPIALDRATMDMDLVLGFVRRGAAVELQVAYSADRFDEASARRLGEQLRDLLADVAAAPDLPVAAAADEAARLAAWSGRREQFAVRCLHHRFEDRVRLAPDAIAVACGDARATYAELDNRASRWAHQLQAHGVARGQLVALHVERSIATVVGILAILKAGAAYVPIDPIYPPERVRFLLADSGVRVVVADAHLIPDLAGFPGAMLDVAELDRTPGGAPGGTPGEARAGSPDDIAYVIYTSGSTGAPKGTMVSHASASRLFDATARWFQFDERDVWTLFHSYGFDFAVWEMWGALLHGGRLVVVPLAVARAPAEFHELLRRERVTVLNQTPSAFQPLIDADAAAGSPHDLALRHVIFGGEALELASLRRWFDRHDDRAPQLVNMYGITETTVHVTYRPIRARDVERAASVIGEPIPDLELHVLDERGERAPIGATGEIHVGGAGVALGYLGRPALTAQRFVPDPFSGRPGARLYRSGDLARYQPDGELEYLGRRDTQVKLRGYRIELGEIEAVLARLPGVRTCAVAVRDDASGDPQLIGYVVGQAADRAQILAGLRERLPVYMMPALMFLDALPMTDNGKLDRRALPAPVIAAAHASAARGPLEAIVAAAFARALGIAGVGRDDSFFELGGHSLRAVEVSTRLRRLCGVPLAIRAVFDHPTVARLAAFIAAQRRGDVPDRPPITPVARGGALPASPTQARLWFLDQLYPGQSAYNVPLACRLHGPLDEDALAAAVADLVRRHEVLRTRYRLVDGELVQVIDPPAQVAIARGETVGSDAEHLAALAGRPFDLSRDWPLRVHLVRRGRDHHLLLLVFHHIAVDGGSLPVVVDELASAYAAVRTRATFAAPPALQVADVAVWQRRLASEPAHARALAYWTRQLAAPRPRLTLPAGLAGHPVERGASEVQRVALPVPATRALDQLGHEVGATRFMTALATFVGWLARIGGSRDVIVGVPSAGREDPALDRLIGSFINTLALRVDATGRIGLRELVARVRAVALDAYDHAAVPFEAVVEALGAERDPLRNPVFDVMFALEDGAEPVLGLTGLDATPVEVPGGSAKLALELSVRVTGDTWTGYFRYDRAQIDPATAAALAHGYVEFVAGGAAAPDAAIDELPLVAPAEASWLIARAHGKAVPAPGSLIARIDSAAARRRDEVAVVDGDRRVRYGELIDWSHAVTRRLAGLGLTGEARVVLVAERSAVAIAALLGGLRAGVALVPIDPETPVDRLRALCAEVAPRHVLVSHARLIEQVAFAGAVTDVAALTPAEGGAWPAAREAAIACMLYTSGSTGRPKGVMLTHGALAWYVDAFCALTELTEHDRVFQFASFGFDASLEEILSTLAVGARLVLRPPGPLESFAGFADRVRREAVTVLDLPTVFWHEWMRAPVRREAPPPASARLLLVAGEAASLDAYRTWREVAPPGCAWINAYGPTEITCLSTALRLAPGAALGGAPAIGAPLDGAQAYVLDDQLGLVPCGVPGELFLGGPGVARGYFAQPGVTAERFVPSPFHAGERLYRTGDRAVLAPDGQLHFLGRRDLQVKLRGVRVELAEVEAALVAAAPGARAAVVVQGGDDGSPELIAYLVPPAGQALDLEAVRVAVARRLPAAMLPAALAVLDEFPITVNGKIDRERLPRPARVPVAPAEPADALECVVLEIWRDVLGRDDVGVDDSFFAAGGHSLLATRIVSRIHDLLGVDTSIRAVFEAPRVRQFAARLAAGPDRARLHAVARLVLEVAGIAWTDRSRGVP